MPGRNLADTLSPTPTPETPAPARLGGSTFDPARYAVVGPAGETRLRPRSADVLRYLVTHAGRVVTKQEILDAVWADVAVTDDSLVQCLIEIRRALGPDQALVRTVRGRGYLLEASGVVALGDTAPAVPDREAAIAAAPGARPGRASPAGRPLARWSALTLAAAVVVALAVLGTRSQPAIRRAVTDTLVPEARQALDEGQAIMGRSRAQIDLERARQLFARAVTLDGGYAAAHAALGNALVLLSGFGVHPPLDLLPQAAEAARRAVVLDPTLAAGWQALAHVQTQGEWDWAGAEQSYRRAMALDPSAPMNLIFAHLLVGIGRIDDAVAESDRLLALAPGDPFRLGSNCIVKYFARRADAAIDACDRALAVNPSYSLAHFWRALALSYVGRHDDAMAAALASRRGIAFEPTWLVGYVHARAGRLAEAREVLTALETRATRTYTPSIDIAFLHAAVGDIPGGLDWLERSHREHGRWMELVAVHPAADPLRAEPRFRAVLRALRLPELM